MAGDAVEDAVDFAFVAYREENVWRVEELAADSLEDLDALVEELRRWPGDFGALGLVSVDEDFFLLVRVAGEDARFLLSDVGAASDWPMAREVVEELELDIEEAEDEQAPAGDLGIVSDLGLPAMDLGALLDDLDLYPDEILGDLAHRLGFGPLYDDLVGVPAS